MDNQTQTPTIQIPGTPPPVAPVAPPAAQQVAPGTPAPPGASRRSRGQRKTKGMPGVPLAVGVVNVVTTAGAEVTMAAGPEAGAAAALAALAAGVYAMRSNARYRRTPWSGPAAAVRSLVPSGPRTNNGPGGRTNGPSPDQRSGPGGRTAGPDHARTSDGPRTSPSGPRPDRTSTRDQRTKTGPDHRTTGPRTSPGPRSGPGANTSGPERTRHRKKKRTTDRLRSGTGKVITAGRTARKGWRKTAPVRRLTKEQIKKLGRRIAWPAVVAMLTGLRKRSWAAAVEAWKNKRKSSDDQTSDTVEIDVKDTVRTPKNSGSAADGGLGRVSNTGGQPSMTVAAYVQATAEMMGAAAVYDPQGMMQVGTDLSQLPVAVRNFAETIRIMTQRSNDNDPIHPAIIDLLGEIYKTLLAAGTKAEDLYPAFRNLHAVDIQRLEAPRKNEQKWDVTANR